MKKYFLLVSAFVFLFSSTGMALKPSSLGDLASKSKKKQSSSSQKDPKEISLETAAEYSARMIDTIKSFMDREYYTEASFLLSDLSNTTSDDATKAEVSELQNKLNELYDPEKENSFYNSDVIVPVKDFTGKYGYIDHTGNFVIPAKYDKADHFHEGMALVEIGNKQVFINRKGEIAIELTAPEKMKIEIRGGFHNGLARCFRNVYSGDYSKKGYIFIDKTGQEVFLMQQSNFTEHGEYECRDFSEGFAAVRDDKKNRLFGFINTKGEWLVEPTFDYAGDFRNGMALVKYPNTTKYGYIDTTGNPVIRPFADNGGLNFQDGAAWVSTKDGFYGQIDKSGNRIFDTKGIGIENVPSYFSSHGDRTDGLTYLLLARAIGGDEPDRDAVIFLDKNNKRVIVRIENRDTDKTDKGMIGAKEIGNYQKAVSFANGRAFIRTRYDGWAMIDMKGNMIIQPQIDWMPVQPFFNGLAKIQFRDKNFGYINREGKIVFKE
jgi:hypothetical protein